MNEAREQMPRPPSITAICVIGIINATQMINLIMSPMSKQVGAFYPFYFTLAVVVSLGCIGGLWFMKRWAALTYGGVLICNQIVLLKMGYWEVSAAVIPVIIILLLFKHLNKMA
ncbi:MAG: hypothetical protein ACU837_11925 [Gammaproteobacteria bacterium]